ncbi:hypothetical protein [Mangrovicella endophytica]|uniref:hypothetical protein n=1 Tax=Mangrovicella endophytica TaxID=2066697 RepID=UPI000C9E8680|nr:hypothetical protein [Mangrovicella endophytica]
MVKDGRAKRAWDAMREAGGSIIDHKGANRTGPTYGYGSFARYMNDLCPGNEDGAEDILRTIEKAARDGAFLAELNENPLTDPKCYSKPVVHLRASCIATVEWRPRNAKEEDCSDGQ